MRNNLLLASAIPQIHSAAGQAAETEAPIALAALAGLSCTCRANGVTIRVSVPHSPRCEDKRQAVLGKPLNRS
ncbi:hypothetical protein [Leisingera sp. S232]|uniref:hypothetical protein n=1 Tax=Leisingera sp. S232 TaxID=3415132 RepID=UPI00086A8FBF|nr:hypothetical protein AB838_01620 [Rhodobacteraceae bacterium (ex Bugula neritina AB1)]